MELTGRYKGFEVEYSPERNEYRVLVEGEFEYKNSDFEKLKAFIDRMLLKKFDRVSAFYLKENYTPIAVEITGVSRDGGIWVSEKDAERISGKGRTTKRRKYYGTLYLDEPENHELLKRVREQDEIEKTVNSEKRALLSKMISYETTATSTEAP